MKTTLEEQIRACQLCPLYLHMPFSPIPGFGNKKAKIVLVGEAPGKDEALVEEPFIGRCGKFLDKQLIEPAGLVRSDLFISNVMKCSCRNGNKNRKPRTNEIEICKDWLTEEIREIQPKVIICLGETACKTFNIIGKINEIVGKQYTLNIPNPIYVLPCQHPSYLQNYSKNKTEQALNVFKKAKELAYV